MCNDRRGAALFNAFALVFLCAAFILWGIHSPTQQTDKYLHRVPETVAGVSLPKGSIDPNSADADELTQIKGVGEKIAERIVREREENGSFLIPEDLTAVNGIGIATVRKIREQ